MNWRPRSSTVSGATRGATATEVEYMELVNDAGDVVASFAEDATGVVGFSVNANVNAQTGTTYTLTAADNGKWITCSNGSAITVTVPAGLGASFNCCIMQLGAGVVTVAESGTNLNNVDSLLSTSGQFAVITLMAYAANDFYVGGQLA